MELGTFIWPNIVFKWVLLFQLFRFLRVIMYIGVLKYIIVLSLYLCRYLFLNGVNVVKEPIHQRYLLSLSFRRILIKVYVWCTFAFIFVSDLFLCLILKLLEPEPWQIPIYIIVNGLSLAPVIKNGTIQDILAVMILQGIEEFLL